MAETPMLATLVWRLPEGPEWEYELNLDGYRLQVITQSQAIMSWRGVQKGGSDIAFSFGANMPRSAC